MATSARSPGRARSKPLKPLRREADVRSGPVAFLFPRTRNGVRGRGCRGHPAFPAPSFCFLSFEAHRFFASLGRKPAARSRECVSTIDVIAGQRVRPEVAGPMTGSAKQSSSRSWPMDCFGGVCRLAMTILDEIGCLTSESETDGNHANVLVVTGLVRSRSGTQCSPKRDGRDGARP